MAEESKISKFAGVIRALGVVFSFLEKFLIALGMAALERSRIQQKKAEQERDLLLAEKRIREKNDAIDANQKNKSSVDILNDVIRSKRK